MLAPLILANDVQRPIIADAVIDNDRFGVPFTFDVDPCDHSEWQTRLKIMELIITREVSWHQVARSP